MKKRKFIEDRGEYISFSFDTESGYNAGTGICSAKEWGLYQIKLKLIEQGADENLLEEALQIQYEIALEDA